MTHVTLEDDDSRIVLRSSYDPDVVRLIKDVVPGYARGWQADSKTWTVDEHYVDKLTQSLTKAGHTVGRHGGPLPAPPKPRGAGGLAEFFEGTGDDVIAAEARAAEFIESTPIHLRHLTFRAMAKALYPDLYSGRR